MERGFYIPPIELQFPTSYISICYVDRQLFAELLTTNFGDQVIRLILASPSSTSIPVVRFIDHCSCIIYILY
jgi:hypothetical protein